MKNFDPPSTTWLPPAGRTPPKGDRQLSEGFERKESADLVRHLRAISVRMWTILAFAAFISIATGIALSFIPPVYESSAVILLETTPLKILTSDEVNAGASSGREYLQTQIEVIKSSAIANRVIEELDLGRLPEFAEESSPGLLRRLTSLFFEKALGIAKSEDAILGSEKEPRQALLLSFRKRLTVQAVRQSQLVRVNFEASDPRIAAQVANAVASAYINRDLEDKMRVSRAATRLVESELQDLRVKLEESELALQGFRENEGLLDNRTTVLSGSGKQLDELTQQLVEARVRRSQAEEAYNQARGTRNYSAVPAVVRNPGVQKAREIRSEVEQRLADASNRLGEGHPAIASIRAELATTTANLEREIGNVINSIDKEYAAAKATERTVESSLQQAKSGIQSQNRKEIQLGALQREVDSNRTIYASLLARSKEITANSSARQASATVVDVATPPENPAYPKKAATILASALLSLLLGALFALIRDKLDNSIRSSQDVEDQLGLPLLASLPKLSRKSAREAARMIIDQPNELYSEGIRTAATGLLFTTLDTPKKVICVTSSLSGEGKTTFSFNYAHWQATTTSTLLIEADLRRPAFSKILNLAHPQKGLSDLIVGTASIDECLLSVQGTKLHLICAGTLPPNPLGLLVSDRFSDIVNSLKAQFEHIVIDCPPVQVVSDALVVGRHCTGLVYVVKWNSTPAPLVRKALRRISEAEINCIGVLLSQQDILRSERYHGEYASYATYGANLPS